jgi:glycosyltransferase involved in cell wall biosynthesis
VLPAYNEAEGLGACVEDYCALPEVDEVVVVDNNSTDKTGEVAEQAGARVVSETRQGYGYASRTALTSARGDLIIIVESDRTFRATDIYKFLSYSQEFDAVFGTRTSKSCIWTGSNMGPFLRYGNWAVGKLLEYVHNGPCLTDVGCTYKLFRRDALRQVEPHFTVGRSHFSPELMILCIRCGLVCVEIPVHYQPRTGTSKITGSFGKAFRLGIRMIVMILHYRLKRIPRAVSSVQTPENVRVATAR